MANIYSEHNPMCLYVKAAIVLREKMSGNIKLIVLVTYCFFENVRMNHKHEFPFLHANIITAYIIIGEFVSSKLYTKSLVKILNER
jgi:hypothetical protein